MRIGEYIKYKRQALGYSQKQFADRLGISKQAVSKWENGTALPDIMTIPDIACILRVKRESLVKIIWIGETGERVAHFVSLNVEEKNSFGYLIKVYEIDDFLYAKEIYDNICAGQNELVMQTLIDYYTYDPFRTFTVTLSESVSYDEDEDEEPYKALLIESHELNSLIKSHIQECENTQSAFKGENQHGKA